MGCNANNHKQLTCRYICTIVFIIIGETEGRCSVHATCARKA